MDVLSGSGCYRFVARGKTEQETGASVMAAAMVTLVTLCFHRLIVSYHYVCLKCTWRLCIILVYFQMLRCGPSLGLIFTHAQDFFEGVQGISIYLFDSCATCQLRAVTPA